jgi:Holliday junction DNA helicase RuvA
MIGRLTGTILDCEPGVMVLDVAGVGYELEISTSTYVSLVGQTDVSIYTHLIVREDAQILFGFLTRSERELFRSLIKVNGVGPKLAITILSGIEPGELVRCITENDTRRLTGLPGVGKKTAERLIIDLRDKLPEVEMTAASPAVAKNDNLADAEAALIGLGYRPQEASRALAQLDDEEQDVESIIRQALKVLS